MSDSQSLILKGHVDIKLYNKYGEIIDERSTSNAITAVGRTILVNKIAAAGVASTSNYYTFCAGVGTGTPTSTDLGAEIGSRVAQAGVLNTSGGTSPNQYYTALGYQYTFAAGNATGTLTEAALYTDSAPSLGICLHTVSFSQIVKGANDSLTIQWKLTINS